MNPEPNKERILIVGKSDCLHESVTFGATKDDVDFVGSLEEAAEKLSAGCYARVILDPAALSSQTFEILTNSGCGQIGDSCNVSGESVTLEPASILSTERSIEDLDLADIIDAQAIQAIMDSFYSLARIPMSIIDLKGKLLVGVGWQDICMKFHRTHPEASVNCIESDLKISAGVPEGEFKLYKCRNGMWDISTPIMIGGVHLGNVFSGQFFFDDEPLDYDFFRDQARRYGFNEQEYMTALDTVPRLSRASVNEGMSFFIRIAELVSELSYSNLKLGRSLAERDALFTERGKAERDLGKLNRTLKALSSSDRAMMRAEDEDVYLNEVCRIVVEECGHKMVWIGYAENDEYKLVRPVAYSGFEEGYLETLKITWADTDRGRGPTGTAIRECKPAGCRNMLTDPKFKPWLQEAIKRGYSSSIVLPLMSDGKAFGAVTVYSEESDPFTHDETALLSELANDLAYGITAIRLRAAHAEAVLALRQNEERYRGLVEVAPDALLIHRDGLVEFTNPAALQLFGASSLEEIVGRPLWDLFHADYHPTIRKRILDMAEGRFAPLVEEKIVRLDGVERDVEVAAAPFTDSAGMVIQVMLRDITDRKFIEQQRKDLYHREHRIAETLQSALIPPSIPKHIGRCTIAARYQPAMKEAEIGGDFYDVFQIDEARYGILIGDVVGKGLAAAISVASARYAIRSYAFLDPRPARVLTLTNQALCRDSSDAVNMLTAFFAVLDVQSNVLFYSSAGHEPPIVVSKELRVDTLQTAGAPLGVFAEMHYAEGTRRLDGGDRMVLVTDGIVEARAPGTVLYTTERLIDYLRNHSGLEADDLASAILEEANTHAGGHTQDDAVIMIIDVE